MGSGHFRRQTWRLAATNFAVNICARSPHGLRVSLHSVTMPRSGFERDGFTPGMSLSTVRASPSRLDRGQPISPLARMIPLAIAAPPPTSSFMVIAATRQPLVARPHSAPRFFRAWPVRVRKAHIVSKSLQRALQAHLTIFSAFAGRRKSPRTGLSSFSRNGRCKVVSGFSRLRSNAYS